MGRISYNEILRHGTKQAFGCFLVLSPTVELSPFFIPRHWNMSDKVPSKKTGGHNSKRAKLQYASGPLGEAGTIICSGGLNDKKIGWLLQDSLHLSMSSSDANENLRWCFPQNATQVKMREEFIGSIQKTGPDIWKEAKHAFVQRAITELPVVTKSDDKLSEKETKEHYTRMYENLVNNPSKSASDKMHAAIVSAMGDAKRKSQHSETGGGLAMGSEESGMATFAMATPSTLSMVPHAAGSVSEEKNPWYWHTGQSLRGSQRQIQCCVTLTW